MDIHYTVQEPENINTNLRAIFYLHGYGSNEKDLMAFSQDLPNDILHVSFRGIFPVSFSEGYSWYDINFNNENEYFNKAQALESLNLLLKSILDIQQRYNIQNGNISLCGFSQGGVLAYALAFKNPQLFSKIACLSSYPESQLIDEIAKDKKKLSNLRFFISHGTEDAVIPLEWGKKGADILYDLSCYFTFREYMYGHGINQKNYIDLIEFLSRE